MTEYKCLLCGRDKFNRPFQPHNCNGQYRKHRFIGEWIEINGVCGVCETRHDIIYLERRIQDGGAWINYKCPITGVEFTADDTASIMQEDLA